MKRDLTKMDRSQRPADDDFDLLNAIRNVRRHRRLFLSVFALCFILGVAYVVVAKPKFKANALVQIDQQQGSALGALADVVTALQLGSNSVDGELDVITSRATIYPAISRLDADISIKVDNRFPIIGDLFARYRKDEGVATPLFGLKRFAWGGERLKIDVFNVPRQLLEEKFFVTVTGRQSWNLTDDSGKVLASGSTGEPVSFKTDKSGASYDCSIVVSQFEGNVGTRFAVRKFSAAATYANISKRFTATQTTRDSSTIEITYTDTDPEFAAELVNAVAAEYVKLNIEHRAEQSRLSLAFLTKKLPEIRQKVDDSERKLNEYRIKSRMIDLDSQTAALLDRAADLAGQQATADVKIAAQTQLFQGPHPTLRVDAAQQKELASQIAATNRKIEALPMAQQEFVRLSLDVDVNTRLYTALLENEQQLEVVDAGTTGNVFVAEHAVAPEVANWPRIEVVLGSAALCGLLFAFVAVQIRATALGTIKDPLELDLLVDLPLLAVIPVSQTQDRIRRSFVSKRKHNPTCLLAHTHTGDRAVEALRSLRSAMQLSTDSAGKTVILFTGPTPNVGKTFISVNFAYLLAASGKRVVLIDADMRRSTVGRYIPLESKDGLAEVLSGRSTVDSVVRSQVQPNLDVIPAAGQRPKHPSELLESSKFADLIEFLRSKYDFVIIDSPPVLPVSDTLWMSRHADAVVVVSRAEITNPRHLIDAMSRLSNVNAKMAGQVFNGFEPRQSGYGYSYGYEYYAEERS